MIDGNPGLSFGEKDFLRKLNWKEIEIDVTDDDIKNFTPASVLGAKETCERTIVKDFAERKCYKI